MESLALAQSLIKSDCKFADLERPVLTYISGRDGMLRAYADLNVNDSGEIITRYFGSPLESIVETMRNDDESNDIEIMAESDYIAKMNANLESIYNVGKPTQINKARFWYMLETLPPCNWVSENKIESFRFSECLASDLFMYFVRVGDHYFEIVEHLGADLSKMIEACKKVDVVDMPHSPLI